MFILSFTIAALAETLTITCELGDTIFLHPSITVAENDSVRWTYGEKLLINKNKLKGDPTKYAMTAQHSLVCGGHKRDSGLYKVEIFKHSGELRKNLTIQLSIKGM